MFCNMGVLVFPPYDEFVCSVYCMCAYTLYAMYICIAHVIVTPRRKMCYHMSQCVCKKKDVNTVVGWMCEKYIMSVEVSCVCNLNAVWNEFFKVVMNENMSSRGAGWIWVSEHMDWKLHTCIQDHVILKKMLSNTHQYLCFRPYRRS